MSFRKDPEKPWPEFFREFHDSDGDYEEDEENEEMFGLLWSEDLSDPDLSA